MWGTERILKNKDGFSAVEVIIVLIGLLAILSVAGVSYNKLNDYYDKKELEAQLSALRNAVITHYHDTIRRAENVDTVSTTTLSVTSPSTFSPWLYMGALPYMVGDDVFVFSKLAYQEMIEHGCVLIRDETSTKTFGNRYEWFQFYVRCKDIYGNVITINPSIKRGPSSTYEYLDPSVPNGLAWDPNTPSIVTISSAGKDRTSGTADDVTVTWNTSRLDEYYKWKSIEKMMAWGRALSNFQKQYLDYEMNYLTHLNSLRSIDDIKVPWEVQSVTSLVVQSSSDYHCNISSVTTCRPALSCSCPYSGNQWGGNFLTGLTYPVFGTARYITFGLMLNENQAYNYKSDFNYWHDSFGMRIGIDIIGKSRRGISSIPVPQDDYTPPYSPPFVSYIVSKFGYSLPVVSAN